MRSGTANCAKFTAGCFDREESMTMKQQGVCVRILILLLGVTVGGLVHGSSSREITRLTKEVEKLGPKCDAARQKALAPIRAQRTQACIEQQLRSKGHCERYYRTYGNVIPSPTGAPAGGYFYDLPPCQDWLRARQQLEVEHSRP